MSAMKEGKWLYHMLIVSEIQRKFCWFCSCEQDNFFSPQTLVFFSIFEQGYDGASNIRGRLNGLETLIMT
jgi:hypothetical protein